MSVISALVAYSDSITNVLQTWETMGVFEYILPFLLVFAFVFGVLQTSKFLGQNKGVNVVLALAIGAMSIYSYTFRSFFATIAPYTGIGIAILLVALILTGLFHSDKNWWGYTFFGLGMLIFAIVVLTSLSSYKWFGGGYWWQDNWSLIVTLAVIVGLIVLVILSTKKKE